MNRIVIIVFITLSLIQEVMAQKSMEAYAQGENTYLNFTQESYDPARHYTVILFSPTGKNIEMISGLTQLADVIRCEWTTQHDLNIILGTYPIKAFAQPDRTLRLDGPDYTVNTTSEYACLVLHGDKIQMLCCGEECNKRLRTFFVITGKH